LVYERIAKDIAKIAEEKKAKDIVLLNLKEISVITDYFVICTGESFSHMRAIAQEIEKRLKEEGVSLLNSGDFMDSRWILLDFGGVIAHIFSKEARQFYQLERLWADAKRVD